MGIVWSVIGIFICGGLGGFAAWALVTTWVGQERRAPSLPRSSAWWWPSRLWTGLTALLRAIGLVR